jgi:chromate reductase, NAD(P)H dehydrogenase (quinone)
MGIAGSLRRGSYNRWLLDAARTLAPPTMNIVPFPIDEIPLYNADYDADHLRPPEVVRLKQTVADADAVLIATPEYNHAVPGVLQNAIDWVSRPGLTSPLAAKPVAIMGASTGAVGTARAQQQLKLVLMSTLALVMPHTGVLVGLAAQKFDASGALVHEPTRQFIAAFLLELDKWTHRCVDNVARP